MTAPILTADEVQTYIRDLAENNHLIDGTEFTPTLIRMAMDLAVSEWNLITPFSMDTVETIQPLFKAVLMSGTLWKLFEGQSALLARNTMNYSDGGIQIPIEERFSLYQSMAEIQKASFFSTANRAKIHMNVESGWGQVKSDESAFPIW